MKFISFKQYIILSRPVLFLLIFLCFVVALFYSVNSISDIRLIHIVFILLLTFLIPFFVFSINDLEDYDSDKINTRKKSILFGKHISNIKEYARCINICELIIFIILICYSLLFFNIIVVIILFFLLFLMYFYSAKPIRFRKILFVDFISNGLMVFLSFALIYCIFNPINMLSIKIYFISISIMSYHLVAAQIDFSSDKLSKQNTSAVYINNKHIIYILSILLNLPLILIKLNSFFKYLFFVNLVIILIIYIFPKFSKLYLFLIFIIAWISIVLMYIINFIF